jgi:broad specificity phosphatase PhoE/CTP:molybdopterin cytidylyltransferase MocA
MKEFKPLLVFRGKSFVENLVMRISKVDSVDEIILVIGHNSENLKIEIEKFSKNYSKKITLIENFNYKKGMFSSIKTGLSFIKRKKANALLFTADAPLVNIDYLNKMMAIAEKENSFYRLNYLGKNGHPLFIPEKYIEKILDYDGDYGIKGFLKNYEIITINSSDEAPVFDLDYEFDYQELKALFNGKLKKFYSKLPKIKNKIFLFRHGLQELSTEKIFLGQTDIPLSSDGANKVLLNADFLLTKILKGQKINVFSSDLKRVNASAKIIKDKFVENNYKTSLYILPDLRELSLGEWDGKKIREIAEQFPKAYNERGKDLISYKILGGENYYDLRYRGIRAIRKILLKTNPSDIVIIVSHIGMLRCIKAILEDNLFLKNYLSFYIATGTFFEMN